MGYSLSRQRRAIGRSMAVAWFLIIMIAGGLAVLTCSGGGTSFSGSQDRFAGPTNLAIAQNFLDPYGHYLFVANSQGGTITVINAQRNSVLSSHTNDIDDTDVIRVGRAPYDLALTPEGDKLFVSDAWLDNVRVVTGWAGRTPGVFDVLVEFDGNGQRSLRYDIEVEELDVVVRAGDIVIQSQPARTGASVPVFVADRDNLSIHVLDSLTGLQFDQIDLGEEPVKLLVTADGSRLFVATSEARILFIDAHSMTLLSDQTVDIGGKITGMILDVAEQALYAVNADPPELHVITLEGAPLLLDTDIPIPGAPTGIARTNDGENLYVGSSNGYLYTYDIDTMRICNSWGGRVFFRDQWPPSDTKLERIEIKDCRVRNEQWEVVYHEDADEWTIRGGRSSLQEGRAISNQYYQTDNGAIGFFIRDDENHASDGDTFYFEVDVGVAPIPVGLIPGDIASTPYYLDPTYDILFVSNSGSHNLSTVFTYENTLLGSIN
jgi:DNA-binding beta-propeller fold protein YncE